MNNKVTDKLNEVLGVAKGILEDTTVSDELKSMMDISTSVQSGVSTKSQRIQRFSPTPTDLDYGSDLENDYHHARDTLKSLIRNAESTLDGLLCLAQDSQHPKAYEVAALLIKNIADVTKELIALQKTMKDIKGMGTGGTGGQSAENIQNNTFVFTGTTSELQKLVREQIGRNT